MGSTSQLYSLTWGEFSTSLATAVQLLRCHGDMVDVTLAAGGRSFPAHKLVLSAASPFLLNLLKSTPCKHPVVLLAGIAASDLEALLEFMYRGEVSVDPNQLPSLLQAAHCLNIQGLATGAASSERPEGVVPSLPGGNEALTRDVINSFLPIRRRKRAKRRASSSSGSESKWARVDDEGRCGKDLENQPCEPRGENRPSVEQSADPGHQRDTAAASPSVKTEGSHLMDDQGGRKNSVSDQPATCPLCGAVLRQSRNLRRHLELLHFGAGRPAVRVSSRKAPPTPSPRPLAEETLSDPESPPSPSNTSPERRARVGVPVSHPSQLDLQGSCVVQTPQPNLLGPPAILMSQHDIHNQSHHGILNPQHGHPAMFVSQPIPMTMNHLSHIPGSHLMGSPGSMLPPQDPHFLQHLRAMGGYPESSSESHGRSQGDVRQGVS